MGRQRIMVIMSYKERVNRVIDFIGKHLDEELELDELCRIACFSKYHFHRLFTAHAGVSLKSYIKWLRLKRAAHQLTVQKEDKIINIALDAGFESHEAFSRAFKQVCGHSPSGFRSNANWREWENPPYSLHIKGKKIMTITIKDLPSRRLAVMEHHGDPMKLSITLDKLISWAKAQPINLKPKAGEAFGYGYHDPRETPPEEWRFDLALTVPQDFKLSDEVIDRELPAGRYAVTTHKGSRDNIGDTIYHLYRDWLPESGEELGDLPCIFCYHNFDHEVAETELLTEIWVLLK
ncbi:MAG: AraC family transcriptional regulator [Candidatus Neptunochlamydia sp.]|nr:AraC family transcriptional regulator [Candidatus Neptunochlamydia sp.]